MHLATIHSLVNELKPAIVVMDPITNLSTVANNSEIKSTLMRLVDMFKNKLITSLFTNLAHPGDTESTEMGVSSLMDTWVLMTNTDYNGERNRNLFILKSRGMPHSNQVREFLMSDRGLDLLDVYLGSGGVLTGSARTQQEARDRAEQLAAGQEAERRQRLLERQRQSLAAQIALLEGDLAEAEGDLQSLESQEAGRREADIEDRIRLAALRQADRKDG
jgi:circadian clock protein KaiC